jgi:hypothetical protein
MITVAAAAAAAAAAALVSKRAGMSELCGQLYLLKHIAD